MAESKRTFQAAKMERDLDERLIQPGAYRDAVNISISSSEDANVGSIENIKGNNLIDNLDAGISQSVVGSFTNGVVIGTYAHPEENKIYYFVAGDDGSGVFEYDTKEAVVNTIIIEKQGGIIDETADDYDPAENTEIIEDVAEPPEFTFEMAQVVGEVKINGRIAIYSNAGYQIESLTDHFDEFVDVDTFRNINVQVTIPPGFSNSPQGKLTGTITVTQPAKLAPENLDFDPPFNITNTGVDLLYTTPVNYDLTEVGFYYAEDTGGTTTVDTYTNETSFTQANVVGDVVMLARDARPAPFWDVPASDITIIDAEDNEVPTSAYNFNESHEYSSPEVEILDNTEFTNYPIKVAQTSTATEITNALSVSEIVSNGTQVVVEDTAADIAMPVKTSVTGLTANTNYVAVGYAINSIGTTYTGIARFKTKTNASQVPSLPDKKLLVVPSVSDTATGSQQIGYGDFAKTDNDYYFSVFATNSDGSFIKTYDLGSLKFSGFSTAIDSNGLEQTDSSLDSKTDITGSQMSGTMYTSRAFHAQLSTGADLTGTIPDQTLPVTFGGSPAVTTNSFAWTIYNQSGGQPHTNATDFIRQVTGYTGAIVFPGASDSAINITIQSGSGGKQPITLEMDNGNSYVTFLADRLRIRQNSNLGDATSFDIWFSNGTGDSVIYMDGKGKKPALNSSWQLQTGSPRKIQSFKVDETDLTNNTVNKLTISDNATIAGSVEFVKGTPTETLYTSNFTLNFAKTGNGLIPKVAFTSSTLTNTSAYNNTGNTASYKIGPFTGGFDGCAIIPLANFSSHSLIHYWKESEGAWDKSKLDVSITGKTNGTDYNYYVVDECPGQWGSGNLFDLDGSGLRKSPAVIIVANPYVLNGGTATVSHTLNITYNY